MPKMASRDFLGGPVVKTTSSSARVQVQFLIGELRSHMLCGVSKRLKKKKKSNEVIKKKGFQISGLNQTNLLHWPC